jgi:hypothetical protein
VSLLQAELMDVIDTDCGPFRVRGESPYALTIAECSLQARGLYPNESTLERSAAQSFYEIARSALDWVVILSPASQVCSHTPTELADIPLLTGLDVIRRHEPSDVASESILQ